MPLLDWGSDDLHRKYAATFAKLKFGDGTDKLVYVSDMQTLASDVPTFIHANGIQAVLKDLFTYGNTEYFGAIHEHSGSGLTWDGRTYKCGHLQGFALKAKYFVCGRGGLYFGSRALKKTFRWGMHKDDWFINRAANAAHITLPKILEYAASVFKKAEHKEYKLLSEEVAIVGGVIKILEVTVGYLDGNHAKVKNAAVGKILSELEPTWVISYW